MSPWPQLSDDPRVARHRRRVLESLAKLDQSPGLAEMARELLSGRTTPAQIMSMQIYDDVLSRAMDSLGEQAGDASGNTQELVDADPDAALEKLEELDAEAEAAEHSDESPGEVSKSDDSRAGSSGGDEEDFSAIDWLRR